MTTDKKAMPAKEHLTKQNQNKENLSTEDLDKIVGGTYKEPALENVRKSKINNTK